MTAGVPQGSVLGPLLFLIFINDITRVIYHCQIRLNADDTCLFLNVDDRNEAATKINEDLENIDEWSKMWLVDFNATKTKSMIVSNKRFLNQHPTLSFSGQQVEEVSSHNHLGVFLSSALKWKEHITNIVIKTSQRLNMLKSLKYKLNRKALETIYKSFILPCLDYGDILYFNTFQTELDRLDRIHMDAMRVVCGATARSSVTALYRETGWRPLKIRRHLHVITMMYKIVKGLVPVSLRAIFDEINEPQHNMQLHSHRKSCCPMLEQKV